MPYYRRAHPELLRIDPYEGVYFYRINIARKPLDNPKVRLALNLAVDREAIVKNILREDQKPATGYTPPGMGEYQTAEQDNLRSGACASIAGRSGLSEWERISEIHHSFQYAGIPSSNCRSDSTDVERRAEY